MAKMPWFLERVRPPHKNDWGWWSRNPSMMIKVGFLRNEIPSGPLLTSCPVVRVNRITKVCSWPKNLPISVANFSPMGREATVIANEGLIVSYRNENHTSIFRSTFILIHQFLPAANLFSHASGIVEMMWQIIWSKNCAAYRWQVPCAGQIHNGHER